jgi:EAL domain-containing protein (putative c-di-GMP-specific phosphodiesterase class I)
VTIVIKRVASTGDFDAVLQPVVDACTGRIHHYEALARFPGAGVALSAHEHISLAERTGLITVFDLAMVRKMIAWLESRGRRHGDLRVAVNVSGRSLGSPPCLADLEALLGENPWLRGRLMFEITESAHIGNLVAANSFLQRLRRRGFMVCLDDFGAGAADFEYLGCLEVDIVKLDGAWLGGARAPRGEAYFRALTGLCRELGIATVAEMVEDEAGLALARNCGATYVQGFLFGMPSAEPGTFAHSIPARLFPPQPASARRQARAAPRPAGVTAVTAGSACHCYPGNCEASGR